MKILHTADWHIGKVLHKHSLKEELEAFFDFLIETIKSESINVLLVSGDIFDLANPSSKDREIYYNLLSKLSQLGIRTIITGGNHDSINLLNAPKEILNHLLITVVGGAKENPEEELIEIKNDKGETELIIAAVPFLRDKDLRTINSDKKYKDRTEAVREGIKSHYMRLAAICNEKYKDIPAIAMGHLYAKGALTSDSEREIQVGNAAAVESSIFSDTFNYVALGHIHRPQVIGKKEYIRYSGSPIALSFSEKEDNKSFVIVEVKSKGELLPTVITIPKQRELKKIKGSLEEVKSKLEKYKPAYRLPSFVELEVYELDYSSLMISMLEDVIALHNEGNSFKILKHKTFFEHGQNDTSTLFTHGEQIEDVSPIEVFKKRLESEEIDSDTSQKLQEAFLEILETIQTEEV